MIVTHYTSRHAAVQRPLRLAVVADLHNGAYAPVLRALEAEAPDLVLLPGDFFDAPGRYTRALSFLSACAALYPTFCSSGNHDTWMNGSELAETVSSTGAVLLCDNCVFTQGVWLGGLCTGYRHGVHQSRLGPTPPPDRAFLSAFARAKGCRILLCHHPEYYEPYLRELPIPYIVAGHAHGGQWRPFGRGLFAPGQGLFPRYTAGFYDGRMLVSRGLCTSRLPRLWNPTELAVLDIWPRA